MTADLATEVARATAAEAAIQADVDANETAANLAISNEESRATAAEGVLDGKIDTEIADRISAIATLQADVDQNEADADAAFVALQADVDQNEADADAAIAAEEAARIAAVSAEEAARISGDDQLAADMDSLEDEMEAQFDALASCQSIDGAVAHDGSSYVFIGSAGSELQMGAGTDEGSSVKVKSKVASGDVTVSGDIEGTLGTSVTLTDNGAVTLVWHGGMWWIM